MTAADTETIARMMSRKEFAGFLDVTTETLKNWEKRGKGPRPIRIGRAVRYRADEVAEFIRGLQQQNARVSA